MPGVPGSGEQLRGIVSAGASVPWARLRRSDVTAFLGSGGGKGTRAVASHHEDTTTKGVEAARVALRGAPAAALGAVWFATASPAYLDKTHATALHADGEATPERHISNGRTLALTYNLGGDPGEMVSFVSIVGTERG